MRRLGVRVPHGAPIGMEMSNGISILIGGHMKERDSNPRGHWRREGSCGAANSQWSEGELKRDEEKDCEKNEAGGRSLMAHQV